MSPITTFLDGTIPTRLRGLSAFALSDAGHLVTEVSTDDGGGGVSQVWTAGTAVVPCRVDDLTGGEQLADAKISDRSTHVIIVPPGVVPSPMDRFAIDGKGTFEITAVRNRTREWLQLLEAVQVVPVS